MSLITRKQVGVEWGDCDPAEIVFYPNYFRWFDVGAHHLFRTAGIDWAQLQAQYGCIGFPLVNVEARFVRPSRFGDTIVVESRVESWERRTLKVAHRVFNGGEVAVEGVETRIWATRDDDGRLRGGDIPEEIKALFEERPG